MANPTTYFGWVMPNSADLVTDLPADFNVFGQGVDTSMQYLLGGTTGQVLSKTSATNMAFTWTTPTDQTPLTTKGDLFSFTTVDARLAVGANETRLVADSVQATGLKYVADTTNYVIAAKADLLVGTAADTVAALTVGTNGQVLTADSTVSPTGLKWATAASTSPDYQLINAGGTALTGAATITVSGISGKNDLMIIVQGASSASASPYITFRLNGDNTSGNYQYTYQGMQSTASIFYGYTSGAEIYSSRLGNSATDTGNGYLQVSGANATGYKPIWGIGAGTGSTTKESWSINGVYKGSSAITSVSVLSDVGNFDAGTIYIYGA